MLLKPGDKVLVAHRRLFERDETRLFVGRVDAFEAGLAKVTGQSYARDVISGGMVGKPEKRTKILSLVSGSLIVYQLPEGIQLERLRFEAPEGRAVLTDGAEFQMDLAEHLPLP